MSPAIAALALLLGNAGTAPAAVPICPHHPGFIDGPVVPTADAAKAIFSIVSSAIAPGRRKDTYVLMAADDGETWMLTEALPPPPEGTTRYGGGGLTMRIDKCSGAISAMHYLR